jgi:hypothetical protein
MASEHVEMEQVPLKSDTDKPAGTDGDETKTEEATPKHKENVITSKFKAVFSRGKSSERKQADMAAENENGKPVETTDAAPAEAAPVEKKKPIWPPAWLQRKKCCEKKCDMSIGLNMNDRDERGLNETVKLNFEDIIAEPDPAHSFDCAWRLTFRTFNGVRCIVYKLLALIVAVPCAIIWGIVFALLTLINVWAATPLARAIQVPAVWLAKTWNFLVRSLFDPLFRSCGLCFSSIHMRRYGMNEAPTTEMA